MKYPGCLAVSSHSTFIYTKADDEGSTDDIDNATPSTASVDDVWMIISVMKQGDFLLGKSYIGWTGVYDEELVRIKGWRT